MTKQMLIITMVVLGLGLSTVIPSSVSPELTKSMAWLIAGVLSKFK